MVRFQILRLLVFKGTLLTAAWIFYPGFFCNLGYHLKSFLKASRGFYSGFLFYIWFLIFYHFKTLQLWPLMKECRRSAKSFFFLLIQMTQSLKVTAMIILLLLS